jgi:hypothetical protein
MSDRDCVERFEFRLRLAETQKYAAPCINEQPSLPIDPQNVACAGAGIIRVRTTGAKHLDGELRRAGCKGGAWQHTDGREDRRQESASTSYEHRLPSSLGRRAALALKGSSADAEI